MAIWTNWLCARFSGGVKGKDFVLEKPLLPDIHFLGSFSAKTIESKTPLFKFWMLITPPARWFRLSSCTHEESVFSLISIGKLSVTAYPPLRRINLPFSTLAPFLRLACRPIIWSFNPLAKFHWRTGSIEYFFLGPSEDFLFLINF